MPRIVAMGDVSGIVVTRWKASRNIILDRDIIQRSLNVVRESWDFGMSNGFGKEFEFELRYPPSLDERLIVMDASLMLVWRLALQI